MNRFDLENRIRQEKIRKCMEPLHINRYYRHRVKRRELTRIPNEKKIYIIIYID